VIRVQEQLKGRVRGELHAAITAYTEYGREATGQAIEVWLLVVQVLRAARGDRSGPASASWGTVSS
jgi:hypothetical protein